jgi:hypothetical protein
MGVQKLGNNIYLDEDIIIRTDKDVYEGMGICMVPPMVKEANFNDSFVVVRVLNNQNSIEYWLIDKTQECTMLNEVPADSLHQIYYRFSNVYGPMDLVAFFKMKNEKRVHID